MIRKTLILLFLLVSAIGHAQVDTLQVIPESWIKKSLRPGKTQYLVFFQNKKNHRKTGTLLWTREVKLNKSGLQDNVEIVQHWYGTDTAAYRYVYSQVDTKTFLPIYHKAISQRGTEAYDFYPDRMRASDTVKNNTRANFELNDKRALNWELDLEIFSLLELKEGKRFAINFYHPGGRTQPMFYEYRVIGSEMVTLFDGKPMDCWKLKIDYNPTSYAVFYISKKGKEVVKMEEDFGMGVRYKVRLATNF